MKTNEAMQFQCGCKMAGISETAFFEPCSSSCDTYSYFIEQVRKLDMPLSVITVDRCKND